MTLASGSESSLPFGALPHEVYQGLIETVSDAVVSTDARQTIVLFNAQAERIFGYSRQEVLGQPLTLLLPEAFRDAHTAHVKNFGAEQSTRRRMGEALDLAARRKNGETFPVEVSIARLGHGDSMLFTAVVRDMTARRRAERLLESVIEATSASVSTDFFRHLVKSLAESNSVTTAYLSLADTAGDDTMRTVAFWHDGRFLDDLEYRIEGTPSAQAVSRGLVFYSRGAWAEFPGDRWLQEERIEGYLGLPLRHTDGSLLGVMAFMSRQAIELTAHVEAALRVFAVRASVEIDRKRAEEEVRQLNADLEARVRDRTSALQTSQARLAEAQEIAHVGSWEYDPASRLLLRSAEACRILGLPPEAGDSFSPLLFERVHPDDRDGLATMLRTAVETRGPAGLECRIVRPDGSECVVQLRAQAVADPPGSPVRLLGTMQDVTEQRATEQELLRREEMLRQSQKMEAVGMLAGGVAHDFNNLLTVIRGHAESLIDRLPPRDAGQRRIGAVLVAVDRAAALTAQLLAFGRKQLHEPKPMDLDEVIGGIEDMLVRLSGRRNKLVRFAEPGLWRIWADRGQIEQVLLNLVANARDAMPHGGPITIETGNVHMDEALAERLGAPAGEYVKLVVRDKGVGMDAELQSHIFEPFFTTKAIGKGTGLGLSTVYGIVQQSGGYIALDSAPGQGTSFAIYFPQLASRAEKDEAMAGHTRPDEVRGGGETILLVEDEDGVRELVAEFLESRGYRVLTGSDGAVALCKAEEHAGPIHLLLTDVVMPVMNGPELVDRMKRERPETKVLFMSGYTPEPTLLGGARFNDVVLIRKPFPLDTLVHTVRDILDDAS
jgi:PAS domain S-box-containing protein